MTAITVEEHGRVLLARLDSPPHGLLVPELADELAALVGRAETDDGVGAVVLTGTHPARFVAHGDVRWMQEGAARTPAVGRRPSWPTGPPSGSACWRSGPRCWGWSSSTGCTTRSCGRTPAARCSSPRSTGPPSAAATSSRSPATCASWPTATSSSAMPEVLLGFTPGGGDTQRLARLVGAHRALLMILEGDGLSPAEAPAAGLVDEVVEPAALLDVALARAAHLAARNKTAVAANKRAVYLGGSEALPAGLHRERVEFLTTLAGPHAQAVALAYAADTDSSGELSAYDRGAYADARRTGGFPPRRAPAPPEARAGWRRPGRPDGRVAGLQAPSPRCASRSPRSRRQARPNGRSCSRSAMSRSSGCAADRRAARDADGGVTVIATSDAKTVVAVLAVVCAAVLPG